MSDSIRKQIINSIFAYSEIIRRNNAFLTDIGKNVYLARKSEWILPALILWPHVEEVTREYGKNNRIMRFRADGIVEIENEDIIPSDLIEDILADLIEFLTGDNWVLSFESGGVNRPAVGDTVTGRTSGATGILQTWNKSSGEWQDGDAAGTFTIRRKVGTFEAENLDIGDETNLASTDGTISNLSAVYLSTGDLADDIQYIQGGAEEYPDQGNQVAGCSATFVINYQTNIGNPYSQN